MNRKEIKSILKNLAVGETADIEDLTFAVRTGTETWSVCDNGEEVAGLTLEAAVEIAAENLGA